MIPPHTVSSVPIVFALRAGSPPMLRSLLKNPVIWYRHALVIPLKCHAHRADDILTAIRIAKEFGLAITLDHCTDGSLIADELAEEGFPAFVGPTFGGKSKIELINKSFDTPKDLVNAGLKVSIITDAPVIPIQYLPMCAGLAVNAGLNAEDAWKAITINPAESIGVGDRIGSLEPGKDADIVVMDGSCFEISSVVEHVFINGKAQATQVKFCEA